MKRLFTFLFMLIVSLEAFTQHLPTTGSPYFYINNTKISGTSESFYSELSNHSFQICDNKAYGTVIGYPATIIASTDATDSLTAVTVILKESDKWFMLEEDYAFFKNQFTFRYGYPSKTEETIRDVKNSEQIHSLLTENNHRCMWNTETGIIEIKIVPSDNNTVGGVVQITYFLNS